MDDEQARKQGQRAIAAGFVWGPGGRDGSDGATYVRPFDGRHQWAYPPCDVHDDGHCEVGVIGSGSWPDFRDPATLGVLVAQVRERHTDLTMCSVGDPSEKPGREWDVASGTTSVIVAEASTEPEAWIAALEAAP